MAVTWGFLERISSQLNTIIVQRLLFYAFIYVACPSTLLQCREAVDIFILIPPEGRVPKPEIVIYEILDVIGASYVLYKLQLLPDLHRLTSVWTKEKRYRVMLLKIGMNISRQEFQQMKFFAKSILDTETLETVKSVYDLFIELEHKGLEPNNLELLLDIVDFIGKRKLDRIITDFIENTEPRDVNLKNKQNIHRFPIFQPIPNHNSFKKKHSAVFQGANSILPCYQMRSLPRGLCVIFAMESFEKESFVDFEERTGTKEDVKNITDVFEKFGFDVRKHWDETDLDIIELIKYYSIDLDHDPYDCFVLFILSHGTQTSFYTSNSKEISVKDVILSFKARKCPTLRHKPKLFFISTCRGELHQPCKFDPEEVTTTSFTSEAFEETALTRQDIHQMNGTPTDSPKQSKRDFVTVDSLKHGSEQFGNFLAEEDFLLAFSTSLGFVSYRSPSSGSIYISSLTTNLQKFAKNHDLLSILVKVNEDVAKHEIVAEGKVYKQIPAPVLTLTKALYFFPE